MMASWTIQRTKSKLSWNHDRLWILPRQCNYWNQKEINNKSECGALAFSFPKRRRLRLFFVVSFIYVNNIFT